MAYKSILDIIEQSKPLQQLQTRTLALQKISAQIILLLPPELQSHVKVADYQHTVLHLELKSAAFATQLRFALPALLQKLCLQPSLQRLREIKYYVQPRQD